MGTVDDSDRYQLWRRIGAGGEGEVWQGTRQLTDGSINVAVKYYHANRFGVNEDLAEVSARLETQAARLRQLHTPGLVVAHESFLGAPPHAKGESDGTQSAAYFVMDYIDGALLSDWAATEPKILSRLAVLEDVAAALDVLHRADQVHADIKPSNLLVQKIVLPDGSEIYVAVLVDFGVMRPVTSLPPSKVVGGHGFIAPELLAGGAYSPASDLYAFAKVCAGLVCGDQAGQDIATAARAVNLPEESIAVLLAGLDPDPDRRSQELSHGIGGWLSRFRGGLTTSYATKPAPAPTTVLVDRLDQNPDDSTPSIHPDHPQPKGRSRVLVTAAASLALMIAALGYWLSTRDPDLISASTTTTTTTEDVEESEPAISDGEENDTAGPTTSQVDDTSDDEADITNLELEEDSEATVSQLDSANQGGRAIDLSSPVQIDGSIDVARDVHRFSFEAVAGQWVSVDVTAQNGSCSGVEWDMGVGVYDADSNPLPDPRNRLWGCRALGPWEIPADGQYDLAVWGNEGFNESIGPTGSYQLTIARLSLDMQTIDLSSPVQIDGSIDVARDVHRFSFEAVAGQWVSVDVTAQNGSCSGVEWDMGVGVYDADSNPLPDPRNRLWGCRALGPWEIPADGQYDLAVWGNEGFNESIGPTGSYQLTIARLSDN